MKSCMNRARKNLPSAHAFCRLHFGDDFSSNENTFAEVINFSVCLRRNGCTEQEIYKIGINIIESPAIFDQYLLGLVR